ncbi:MAG: NAD(P)-binding domain-containing protein [Acidimicrobiia bacterium]
MNVAVLGTGMVGKAIATKLVECGHNVCMGSRTADNSEALSWSRENDASNGTFNDAALFGEILFNCTSGLSSIDALKSIDRANINGKIIIDIANEIDSHDGKPVPLASAKNILGLKIQNAFPEAKVVKTLNTVNATVMVNPNSLTQPTSIFLSGNDDPSKSIVKKLLNEFGWVDESIIDLGPIETAAGPEMFLSLWLSIFLKDLPEMNPFFNIKIVQ